MLAFNDLLKKEMPTVELSEVLMIRHTPTKKDGSLRKILPWLAAEHPKTFNAYQQTQNSKVEVSMRKAKYVASFIGLENDKERLLNPAVFVGLYKNGP